MSHTATLACPDGHFAVTYRAELEDETELRERQLANDLGAPVRLGENGNRCPVCDQKVDLTRGEGE